MLRGRSIYGLRKSYDRAREKADRTKDAAKRMQALRLLDRVEPTLVMLEEQQLSRRDRGRFYVVVKQGIEQAKFVLEEKQVK